jgi:hypothetical protein
MSYILICYLKGCFDLFFLFCINKFVGELFAILSLSSQEKGPERHLKDLEFTYNRWLVLR